MMFSKNLKYYRLRKQLTKKALAEKASVSPMMITYYENGERRPSMDILKKLADALDVKVSDFLTVRNQNISFNHGEFRKNSSLNETQQEYVRESVEEHFERFMTAVEVLGGNVLPTAPDCHTLGLGVDDEQNAKNLREHLGLAKDGPIEDLIGKLENKGILVFECNIGNQRFSGINGFVNERPYIAFNGNMNAERNRSTIGHELAHLMFKWETDMDPREEEARATAISGAFLFPKDDAIRELGIKRSSVTGDMLHIAKEYGISMLMLTKRAELCGILSQQAARSFYMEASRYGWRTNEPSRIQRERPTLFEQLVFRAVSEQEISVQKGAELLNTSYSDVMDNCTFEEEL